MKPFCLIALLVVGASANYGGYNAPAIRVESYAPQAAPAMPSYSAPAAPSAPAQSYDSYGSSATRSAHIPITRFNHEITGSDSSSLTYETGHGINVNDHTKVVQGRGGSYMDENGKMVQSTSSLTKTGSYSYTSPEGQKINLNWQADENGFRAQGDHLPTPPPVPVEHIRAAAAAGSYSSSYGSYAAPAAAPARHNAY